MSGLAAVGGAVAKGRVSQIDMAAGGATTLSNLQYI